MIWLLLGVATSTWAAPVDLLADLDQFRSKSLLLRSETERLDASSAATLSRLLAFTPSVGVGVAKTEASLNGSRSSSGYWRASADWNVFRSGSDFFAWKAAEKNEEAQRIQLQNQQIEVERKAAQLIFRRLYLRDVRQAQMELLQLKQESLRIGRSRYSQGKAPLQEVSKMELDLSQQQNAVRKAEIEIAENELAYKTLFVDTIQTNQWPMDESQPLALDAGDGSLSVKRLEYRAFAAENSWNALRLRHLPSMDITFSYKESPLRARTEREWLGAIELSLPIWSRFELTAASAQGYADFMEASADVDAGKREEVLRRELLRKKIDLTRANLKDARQTLERSARLYADMLRSFQLGRLSTNDLFQEQDRKIRSLLSYSESRLLFHESLIEACALWGMQARACLQ